MPVCIGGNSPVRRKVLATALSFPQESILKERRRRTHPGVNQSEPTIEDAAVEDILAPKPEDGPQRYVAKRRPAPLSRQIGGAHPALRDDLIQVMPQVSVGGAIELVRRRHGPNVNET